MLTVNELIKIIKSLPRPVETKFYEPAPVIHAGFPSCFNLSFAEYEMLHEFNDQYLHCDHDLVYSKIQPCIRHQDWTTIVEDKENRYRYLSLFNMADISSFMLFKSPDRQEEVAKNAIKAFIDFIKIIKLDTNKLVISYFSETPVKEATNNKYSFDFTVPTDPHLQYWKELGVKDSQLIPDKTRDTLLSLRVFGKPTPWGYRNEIHYNYKGKLLDIGTVEYMKYEPLFNEKNEIFGLKHYEHSLGVSAIGLERVAMVLNELDNIWDVDTIKPLVDLCLDKSTNPNKDHAMIVIQAIRAIHSIISDGGEYKNLNSRRKKYFRDFCKKLFGSFRELHMELSRENLQDLLALNSVLQNNERLMKVENIVILELLKRSETVV